MRIKVTEDKDLANDIRARIQANDGYCPCAIIKSPDTKCMCKAFMEQDYAGECHCGLYIKTLDEDN